MIRTSSHKYCFILADFYFSGLFRNRRFLSESEMVEKENAR